MECQSRAGGADWAGSSRGYGVRPRGVRPQENRFPARCDPLRTLEELPLEEREDIVTGPDNPSDEKGRAVLALVAVQVLFGIHYSVAAAILDKLPPAAWAVIRCTSAAFVLVFLVVATRRSWPRGKRNWASLAGLSVLGVFGNQILFIEGISRSLVLHSVLIMSTIPLQTLLLSVFLKQEVFSWRKAISVAAGTLGVLVLLRIDQLVTGDAASFLVTNKGAEAGSAMETVLAGDLLMLANSFCFSLFLVLSKRPAARLDPLTMTASVFGLGAIGVIAYGANELMALQFAAVPGYVWGLAVFAVLGATVGTYLLNYYAIRRVPASMVGVFIYLQFLVATVVGVSWRKERFDTSMVIAAGLVLGGLSLRLIRRPSSP